MRMRKILLGLTVSLAVAGLVACGTPDKDVAATKKRRNEAGNGKCTSQSSSRKIGKKSMERH